MLYRLFLFHTATKRGGSTIQAQEMKFLRRVSCSKLDRIRNSDIRNELSISSINKGIRENKNKWKEHDLQSVAVLVQVCRLKKCWQIKKKMDTVTGKVPNICSVEEVWFLVLHTQCQSMHYGYET